MATEFVLNNSKTFTVEEVKTDSENWLTKKSDSFEPNKDQFVLDAYNKKFPNNQLESANKVYKLASRNANVAEWLANLQIDFVTDVRIPRHFNEHISQQDFRKADESVVKININLRKESEELRKAGIEYNNKIKGIRDKYAKENTALKSSNIIKVLTLSTQRMPIKLAIMIDNFKVEENGPTQKAYARETFVNYQVALLKLINENKDNAEFNIDDVINDLAQK